jgi:hypothetical protein
VDAATLDAGFEVVRVDPDAAVATLALPAGLAAREPAVRASMRGTLIRTAYDRERAVVFHVLGDGLAAGREPNLAAWALASALRGLQLDYALYGPVLLTGGRVDGEIAALPPETVARVRWACWAARSVLRSRMWREGGPMANAVLTAVAHGLTAVYN